MHNAIGLYLHIPFCEKKCAYCDFYSAFSSEQGIEDYLQALYRELKKWGGQINRPIDTIYIGGGTPSVLGNRIEQLIKNVRESFEVLPHAEITAEMNPSDKDKAFLSAAAGCGVNRISIGVQCSDDKMLRILGRTHTLKDGENAVRTAREMGIDNISLDLMIGLPDSSIQTLERDIDFVLSNRPEHISSYILKLEEKTALFARKEQLNMPDDDSVAEQYLYMCRRFESEGYGHYEISNFSKPQRESRHNLKYWQAGEYLGIGPAAHSFLDGKRFFYPRDLRGFKTSPHTVLDGAGGSASEKMMLGLRLKAGINLEEIYGEVPKELHEKARMLKRAGLLEIDFPRIRLTDEGMLVSNSVILELTL